MNRLWGELVGEGFYEPIDDMGPDRKPSAPKAVELLSRDFAKSGYDIKWLFRTICATEAYQRESRPRREADGTPFVANVAQPLRSDQLFNAILECARFAGARSCRQSPRPAAKAMGPYGLNASVRQGFEVAFGYDPSDPRETVNSSIPQALALMNGVRINLAVRAIGHETMLGRLLEETDDNERRRRRTVFANAVARTDGQRNGNSIEVLQGDQEPAARVRRSALGAGELVGVFTPAVGVNDES